MNFAADEEDIRRVSHGPGIQLLGKDDCRHTGADRKLEDRLSLAGIGHRIYQDQAACLCRIQSDPFRQARVMWVLMAARSACRSTVEELNPEKVTPLYAAAVEAVEEAVINSLVATKDTPTFQPPGQIYRAIDAARLAELFRID